MVRDNVCCNFARQGIKTRRVSVINTFGRSLLLGCTSRHNLFTFGGSLLSKFTLNYSCTVNANSANKVSARLSVFLAREASTLCK